MRSGNRDPAGRKAPHLPGAVRTGRLELLDASIGVQSGQAALSPSSRQTAAGVPAVVPRTSITC